MVSFFSGKGYIDFHINLHCRYINAYYSCLYIDTTISYRGEKCDTLHYILFNIFYSPENNIYQIYIFTHTSTKSKSRQNSPFQCIYRLSMLEL